MFKVSNKQQLVGCVTNYVYSVSFAPNVLEVRESIIAAINIGGKVLCLMASVCVIYIQFEVLSMTQSQINTLNI